MKAINFVKGLIAAAGSTAFALMFAAVADAANPENVVVEVTFVSPITVTEVNPLQFGLLDVGMAATDEVTIAPDDSVTDLQSNVIGGTQAAADLTIGATAGATINILVDNVTTGTGYLLKNWTCDYEAGADTACDGAGMNVTAVASGALRVGVTLEGDGFAVAGNQDGSFDVTVAYQ